MISTADTDATVRRRTLAAINSGAEIDAQDVQSLARLFVRDGAVVDGGLICLALARSTKTGEGSGALRTAQSVLAGVGVSASAMSAMPAERAAFLKNRVESELQALRASPGVATLLLLLDVDRRLRDRRKSPPNWGALAYRLALAGNDGPGRREAIDHATHPAILRRDAFDLAWEPAVARGEELKLAEKVLDADTWPRRARAAMIRRLWQQARRPWEYPALTGASAHEPS